MGQPETVLPRAWKSRYGLVIPGDLLFDRSGNLFAELGLSNVAPLDEHTFTVGDTVPPEIISVGFSRKSAAEDNTVTAAVNFDDDGSGLALGRGYFTVVNVATNASAAAAFVGNNGDVTLTGNVATMTFHSLPGPATYALRARPGVVLDGRQNAFDGHHGNEHTFSTTVVLLENDPSFLMSETEGPVDPTATASPASESATQPPSGTCMRKMQRGMRGTGLSFDGLIHFECLNT